MERASRLSWVTPGGGGHTATAKPAADGLGNSATDDERDEEKSKARAISGRAGPSDDVKRERTNTTALCKRLKHGKITTASAAFLGFDVSASDSKAVAWIHGLACRWTQPADLDR